MNLNLPCPSGITCVFDYQDCTATSWVSQIGTAQFEVHSPILHQDYVAFVGSDSSYAKITYGGVSGGNATNSDYCIRYVVFKNISGVYTNWRTIIGNETGSTYCSTIAMNSSGRIQFTRRDISTNYSCSAWHVVCWTSDKINHTNTLWIDAVKIGTSSGCDGWGSDTYLAKGPSWGYSDNNTAFGCYVVGDTIPSDADIISNMKYLMGQYTSDWKLNLNPDNLDIYHKPKLDVYTCLEPPYPKPMWFISENPYDIKTAATLDYHTPCFDFPYPAAMWYITPNEDDIRTAITKDYHICFDHPFHYFLWYPTDDPQDVTHDYFFPYIAMGAFKNCQNMTYIKIPPTVTRIGEAAFVGTNLTIACVPEGCLYDRSAFPEGCEIYEYPV